MDRRLAKIVMLFGIYLLSANVWAQPDISNLTGLPLRWVEYLKLDWNFNVPGRPLMPERAQVVKDVYRVFVTESGPKGFRSHTLGGCDDVDICTALGDSQFLVLSDQVENVQRTPGLRVEKTTIKAVKLQSMSTHLLWESDTRTQPKVFFLKTHGWGGPDAVSISDLLGSIIPTNDPVLDFFPEPLAIGLYSSDQKVHASFRSLRRHQKDKIYIPLHGYIGQVLGDKGENGHDKILESILPLLGRAMARLHFLYGIYHASHTQNLVLELDPVTRQPIRIIIRDLRDAYAEPTFIRPTITQSIFAALRKNKDLLFGNVPRTEDPRNRDVGYFLITSLGQSIFGPFKDADARLGQKALAVFIRNYIAEAKNMFPAISGDIEDLFGSGQSAEDELRFTNQAIRTAIFNTVAATPEVSSESQSQLETEFWKLHTSGSVSALDLHIFDKIEKQRGQRFFKEPIHFTKVSNMIFVRLKKNEQIFAVGYTNYPVSAPQSAVCTKLLIGRE